MNLARGLRNVCPPDRLGFSPLTDQFRSSLQAKVEESGAALSSSSVTTKPAIASLPTPPVATTSWRTSSTYDARTRREELRMLGFHEIHLL